MFPPDIHADICEFVKRKSAAVLQPREQQMFDYFRANAGRVISRDELSLNVWGFIMDGRSRTIDQTVATLRKKLSSAHDIITHHREGYEYVKR